jgi:hypothetical protein
MVDSGYILLRHERAYYVRVSIFKGVLLSVEKGLWVLFRLFHANTALMPPAAHLLRGGTEI